MGHLLPALHRDDHFVLEKGLANEESELEARPVSLHHFDSFCNQPRPLFYLTLHGPALQKFMNVQSTVMLSLILIDSIL